MNWQALEWDKKYVVGKLREGLFDGLETVTRVAETEFFLYLLQEGNLKDLAATYPTPRKREDVPLWVYLSSEISLRINMSHGFKSFPYVLPCGGLRDIFGPEMVSRVNKHDGSDEVCDRWEGFNQKNVYARTTVCDADYLRKMARDTDPDNLQAWYNHAVARYYQGLDVYDPDGIFIADGTYLFVPNNAKYEKSAYLTFDGSNHPVSPAAAKKMSEQERRRLHHERCYRKVCLIHTTWEKDFYLYTGVKLMGGHQAESPELLPLVDQFINAVGKGVMKVLIYDRGFLDGPTVTQAKKHYEVDTIFPLKKNMYCWDEAWRLAEISEEPWREYLPCGPEMKKTPVRPEYLQRREEKRQETLQRKRAGTVAAPLPKTYAKAIKKLKVWDTCEVDLNVVALRDVYEDGREERWVLATTMKFTDPFIIRQYYQLRPTIEERIRQTKCFWDLTKFRSTKFSLVANQIVFVLMAYTLVQIYLLRTARKELVKRTRERLFQELMVQKEMLALYCDRRVALFSPLEYQELLLTLEEHAKRKILGITRKLQAQSSLLPHQPWRP